MKLVDGEKEIEIERAQVLEIRKDDVIVITLDRQYPEEAINAVRNLFAQMFPGRKVVTLMDGVGLSVAREAPHGA